MIGTILAALVPSAIDTVRKTIDAATTKWIGYTVDEQIKLQTAEVERLKALATLDNPYGTPATWVINLRASFRYVAAIISILAGVALGFEVMQGTYEMAEKTLLMGMSADLIGIPFAFIFGERMRLKS